MAEFNEVNIRAHWKGAEERRRSPRLECYGSAQLRMLDPDSSHTVQFPGKIVNLSLIGCCIETENEAPVRVNDRLEVYFQLNGMPVLVMGIARAIHPQQRLGIEFQDVSQRKLEQLQFIMHELLEQLTEKVMKKA
jgi:PilZ domain